MKHPDRRTLTQWAQGWAEAGLEEGLPSHLKECPECRHYVEAVRAESGELARALAPRDRLLSLKESLLRSAAGPLPRPRSWGAAIQFVAAAIVLFGLFGVVLSPRAHHTLDRGRLSLGDGRTLEAPADLPASEEWKLRAEEPSSLRLADRTQVELGTQAQLEVARGQLRLASGEAEFWIKPGAGPRTVWAPTGRVEGSDSRFLMKTVADENGGAPMKGLVTGVIVTVAAGSLGLANPEGTARGQEGQSLLMLRLEAPLLVASPQDTPEQLLKRLEKLAASISKLETEIAALEARNVQLKEQLKGRAGGLKAGGAPGAPGAVWVQSEGQQGWTVLPGANPDSAGNRLIELREAQELLQRKTTERKEK